MESLEISGKTVDEAVETALKELGMDRSQVQIEILKEGKPGILGFRSGEAKVRITPIEVPDSTKEEIKEESIADMAKETLEKLLSLMGMSAEVQLKEDSGKDYVSLEIVGDDLGILIGRRGSTISALQYVVSLIVSRKIKSRARITVDAADYQKRRRRTLHILALRSAEVVRATKRPLALEPMLSEERRIVHLALRDDPAVVTQSTGGDRDRQVVILPRRRERRTLSTLERTSGEEPKDVSSSNE